MAPRITLRDIAEKAEVHVTTVSMALRDSPKLAQETKTRIQALAQEMGYRPDPMLSALNAYRRTKQKPQHQGTIAWINNYPKPEQLYAAFGHMHQAAVSRAYELGFRIQEFQPIHERMPSERLNSILKARGIEGILLPPQPNAHYSFDLNWDDFSVLSLSESLESPRLHTFSPHQYGGMQVIMHHLRLLGYRRIGLVVSEEFDSRCDHNWQAGFWVDYHRQESKNQVTPHIHKTPIIDFDCFQNWFKEQRPEVIIAEERETTDAIQQLGLRIPEELGFVKINARQMPDCAGIIYNPGALGIAAVNFLVSMLQRSERGIPQYPQRIRIDGIWNPGTTVRKIN